MSDSFGAWMSEGVAWRSVMRIVRATVLVATSWALVAVAGAQTSAALRDGAHDFDFNIGVWHTHIRRIPDPWSGSDKSVVLDGTVTVRKVFDGRAQLEEIEADGPNGHWEGMTLFLYNPQAHQWSQSFIESKMAALNSPEIGAFHDGRGELFSSDTFNGKAILVRAVWSNITPDSHRFEESYSNDGGKTWAPAFIAELTREKEVAARMVRASAEASDGARDEAQHAFDFDLGTWKTHSSRLLHPLTGWKDWVELDGTSVVKKVWGGKANLAEYRADGPVAGHLELMALRWFNPTTHEWNIDFATPNVGMFGAVPGVGQFKNGRGDFYDYELIGGKSVLVRFSMWSIDADHAQSEQAFSDDGGKTWEVNWINKYTRVKEE
jgi:BNR/Asp-box repeat